ncbi:MAG: ABC transporter ATP-binding protein [Solirubrobacterales bacterium]
MELLHVKNLKVSCKTMLGEINTVRGIDFQLYKGQVLAIVGESGCGKTVTGKALMRLIEEPLEIKGGSVIYNGEDVFSMDEKQLKNLRGGEIGVIFQDSITSLNPTMKIGEQIAENLIIHRGMKKADAFKEAVKILETVNISNSIKRANQYPHELSGGMRQKAAFAMAISCKPKILIADEPATALDVISQSQILEILRTLKENKEISIIIITHDFALAADISDNMMVMYAGQVVEKGTKSEILDNPAHPYTRALLSSVNSLNEENKGILYSIPGTPQSIMNEIKECSFANRCSCCMEICVEESPLRICLSETHEVMCWLKHPFAMEVDFD